MNKLAHSGELEVLMATYAPRSGATQYMPAPRVIVDRVKARTAAWYEFFPRSAEGSAERGSTFRDCLGRVDDAKAMGFDVIYFPPIHPIGLANRKGANNSVTCEPGEPGVPYAIGNRHLKLPNGGGHKDIEPSLGTMADFVWLEKEIKARGMEIALDFAINCSPDHPYVARASGLVLQTPGRHDQIRGESAEEVRGHLSAELPLRRLGGALGGDEKHHSFLGGKRGAHHPGG